MLVYIPFTTGFFSVALVYVNVKFYERCVVDHCSVVLFSFFARALYCLSFDLQLLMTTLASSNNYCMMENDNYSLTYCIYLHCRQTVNMDGSDINSNNNYTKKPLTAKEEKAFQHVCNII